MAIARRNPIHGICLSALLLMTGCEADSTTAGASDPRSTIVPVIGTSVAIEDFPDPNTDSSVIDRTFIAGLEQLMVKQLEKAGSSDTPVDEGEHHYRAKTMRFSQNGEELMVSEFFVTPDSSGVEVMAPMKVFWWVQAGQLKRVFCHITNLEVGMDFDFDYRRGPCADAVSKTFNYPNWVMP